MHGIGTEKSVQQSANLLIQAVEYSSDPHSKTQLVWDYENGFGVGIDLLSAKELYQSIVADGHRLSNINLGRLELGKGPQMNQETVINYIAN